MSASSVLRPLLNKLETAHLEHMSPTAGPERLAQTVCAFLNTGGGTVIAELGTNQAKSRQRKVQLETEVRSKIVPPALWSATLEEVDGEYYCLVDVPAGRDRPYTIGGTIYVRRGAHTLVASPNEIRNVVETSFSESERWERRLIPAGDIERLDEALIRKTADEAQARRNYPFTDATKVKSILTDLGLYRQQAITQGAEVAFGLRPAIQFPQIRTRVTVYSTDKGGDFAFGTRGHCPRGSRSVT